MHIKKGDTVVVLSGKYEDKKDKNGNVKTAKVLEVSPEEGKVIVEGANMQTKHVKPRRQGETGGIVKVEGAMYADKVAVYCNNCKAGRRTKTVVETVVENGKKVRKTTRVCAKCGKES